MTYLAEKAQQLSQMKSIDAAAVVTGFAVWADRIPVVVGLFTVLWLGMQMIINFPRLCESIRSMYRWLRNKTQGE